MSEQIIQQIVRPRRDFAAGIYIHVPFCERVCPYCDFAVTARKDHSHEAYADALIAELDERAHEVAGREVQTVYFGGGTPSRFAASELARVLEHARKLARCKPLREVTIEANPGDVSAPNLEVWRAAGVGRISLGCQSFQARVLKALGRNHSGERALGAIEQILAAGFEASLDLIYGAPGQTEREWARDLEVFKRLVSEHGLGHVSAYNLTIEARTPFARLAARGELEVPGEDACVRFHEMLAQAAGEVGVQWYEVSSWSVEGSRAVHNSLYWKGAEYLGVGVGAHSLRIDECGEVRRRANARGIKGYGAGEFEEEVLSGAEHLEERVFVGLRTREGVDLGELSHQFGEVYRAREARILRGLEQMRARGLAQRRADGVWAPSEAGLLLADALGAYVVGEF